MCLKGLIFKNTGKLTHSRVRLKKVSEIYLCSITWFHTADEEQNFWVVFHKKVNKFKHDIGQPPLLCPHVSYIPHSGQPSTKSMPLIKGWPTGRYACPTKQVPYWQQVSELFEAGRPHLLPRTRVYVIPWAHGRSGGGEKSRLAF